MPAAPLVQVLPRSVNPRKFAYQDTSLAGTVASVELPRLRAAVLSLNDTIDAQLRFYVGGDGKAVVDGHIEAAVTSICQRCLEPVAQVLSADVGLALVLNEEQSKLLPKSRDPWIIDSDDGSANLYTMIEDELLLALPMVAMHEQMCINEELLHDKELVEVESEQKSTSPFAVLGTLKSKDAKTD